MADCASACLGMAKKDPEGEGEGRKVGWVCREFLRWDLRRHRPGGSAYGYAYD